MKIKKPAHAAGFFYADNSKNYCLIIFWKLAHIKQVVM